MEDNYNKAFAEVVEILKHVPEESVQKIPQDMRDMFEEEMDKDYIFEVKDNVEFEDLKLLDETKAILANIFRDYWATPYQRERIMAKEKTAVYFQLETMRKIEQEYKDDNCASKTEFIEKAVTFYIGYLRQQQEVNYLSPMITETVKAQIKGTEQRLARLMFKVAVELGKLSHMTAAINDVDDETLESLHAMCVNEVRKINGIIDYENAVDFQQG